TCSWGRARTSLGLDDGEACGVSGVFQGAEVAQVGESGLLHQVDGGSCPVPRSAVDEVGDFRVEVGQRGLEVAAGYVETKSSVEVARRVLGRGAYVDDDRVRVDVV